MPKAKPRTIKVYCCGIDWQHELGEAVGGNTLYPDIQDCKDNNPCWAECGIVELKLTLSKWVEPQDLFKNTKPTATAANMIISDHVKKKLR